MAISTTPRWKPTTREDLNRPSFDQMPDEIAFSDTDSDCSANSLSSTDVPTLKSKVHAPAGDRRQESINQIFSTNIAKKTNPYHPILVEIDDVLAAPPTARTCKDLALYAKNLRLPREIPEEGAAGEVLTLSRTVRQVKRCKIYTLEYQINQLTRKIDRLLAKEVTGETCLQLKDISAELEKLKNSIPRKHEGGSKRRLSSAIDSAIQLCRQTTLDFLLSTSHSLLQQEPTFANRALLRGIVAELKEFAPTTLAAADRIRLCELYFYKNLVGEIDQILSEPQSAEGGWRLKELHQQIKELNFTEEETVTTERADQIRAYLARIDYAKALLFCDMLFAEPLTDQSLKDLREVAKVLENLKKWIPEASQQLHKVNLFLFDNR